MPIVDLFVQNFRNIAGAELRFSSHLNIIAGANGAGKTSLLEALHFLGRTQSFRTSHTETLIREGSSGFLLRSRVEDTSGTVSVVGVERDRLQLRVRLGGRPIGRLSELLPHFPFQVFTPDSHELLEGGPRYRRKYLDWGVFHVEPAFFSGWQRYTRALKQRNAALRAGGPPDEVQLWDRELVESAQTVDELRRNFLEDFVPCLTSTVANLTGFEDIDWEYRPGWSRKLEFQQVLRESLDGDRRQGFTRSGPHRADLLPRLEGVPVYERVSRGQQKQIAIAMMLAQADIYRRRTGRRCIFLMDDLASELDAHHCELVQEYLGKLQAQVFLTVIEPSVVDVRLWREAAVFHVEHGHVRQ